MLAYKSGRIVVFDGFAIAKSLQNWVCLQKLLFQLANDIDMIDI
jgi:hypothetical protein